MDTACCRTASQALPAAAGKEQGPQPGPEHRTQHGAPGAPPTGNGRGITQAPQEHRHSDHQAYHGKQARARRLGPATGCGQGRGTQGLPRNTGDGMEPRFLSQKSPDEWQGNQSCHTARHEHETWGPSQKATEGAVPHCLGHATQRWGGQSAMAKASPASTASTNVVPLSWPGG